MNVIANGVIITGSDNAVGVLAARPSAAMVAVAATAATPATQKQAARVGSAAP